MCWNKKKTKNGRKSGRWWLDCHRSKRLALFAGHAGASCAVTAHQVNEALATKGKVSSSWLGCWHRKWSAPSLLPMTILWSVLGIASQNAPRSSRLYKSAGWDKKGKEKKRKESANPKFFYSLRQFFGLFRSPSYSCSSSFSSFSSCSSFSFLHHLLFSPIQIRKYNPILLALVVALFECFHFALFSPFFLLFFSMTLARLVVERLSRDKIQSALYTTWTIESIRMGGWCTWGPLSFSYCMHSNQLTSIFRYRLNLSTTEVDALVAILLFKCVCVSTVGRLCLWILSYFLIFYPRDTLYR